MNIGLKMITVPFAFYFLLILFLDAWSSVWLPLGISIGIGTMLGYAASIHIAGSGLTGEGRTAAYIAATLTPVFLALDAFSIGWLLSPTSQVPQPLSAVLIIIFNALYVIGIVYMAIDKGGD